MDFSSAVLRYPAMEGKEPETKAAEVAVGEKPPEGAKPEGPPPAEKPPGEKTEGQKRLPGTPEVTEDTEEFAAANVKATRELILALTPEKASGILEDILNMGPDLEAAWESMGAPPPLPNPLPGPSLAILLEGKVSDEEP